MTADWLRAAVQWYVVGALAWPIVCVMAWGAYCWWTGDDDF